MKRRSAFDELRDQRAVEDAQRDLSLMCSAHGCPNRWSVDPGRLCSAHAWVEPAQWPEVTQQQRDNEAQRAIEAAAPKIGPRYIKPDPVKLRRYLTKLSDGIRNAQRSPLLWAATLKEREEAGAVLTAAQREAWRAVESRKVSAEEVEA